MSTPLSQEQISQFENEGYLTAYGLLDRARDLQPVIDEYHELLDHLVDR